MKNAIILIFILILSGCSTARSNMISKNYVMQNNEGIMLARITCGNAGGAFNVYDIDVDVTPLTKFLPKEEKVFFCLPKITNDKIVAIALPEGRYYLAGGAEIENLSKEDVFKFNIEKNKINYVGDIILPSRIERGRVNRHIFHKLKVSNKEKSTRKDFEEMLPTLTSHYSFINNVAKK